MGSEAQSPSVKPPSPHFYGSLSPIPTGETKKQITVSWLAGMRKPDEHISLEEIWLMRSYEDMREKGTNIKVRALMRALVSILSLPQYPSPQSFDSLENQTCCNLKNSA